MRAADVRAGTVGEDVLTVHALEVRQEDDRAPYARPLCDAGQDGAETCEWLRRVNCEACLRAITAPKGLAAPADLAVPKGPRRA
ncbi:hypothetical protein ACFV0R_11560 [Streptomyces sp. NPDC059578]|uniref:hypothetical protein n=1 Tax=Streptomyces sp. NPDC059578 TaxID=3346874 RepID=UPI0036B2AD36